MYVYSIYTVFLKLVHLAALSMFSMSSIEKYKNKIYVMFARTRRKQFSITMKGVSLWNSLHKLVKLQSLLKNFEINLQKVLCVNIDFPQNI